MSARYSLMRSESSSFYSCVSTEVCALVLKTIKLYRGKQYINGGFRFQNKSFQKIANVDGVPLLREQGPVVPKQKSLHGLLRIARAVMPEDNAGALTICCCWLQALFTFLLWLEACACFVLILVPSNGARPGIWSPAATRSGLRRDGWVASLLLRAR